MFGHSKEIPYKTYRAGLLQAKAHRALTQFMSDALSPYDISLPDWAALGLLNDNKSLQPSELATRIGVKPPVVSATVRRLTQKKLVQKQLSSTDGRSFSFGLTDRGRETVNTVEKELRQAMKSYLPNVKVRELMNYIRVLEKLANK